MFKKIAISIVVALMPVLAMAQDVKLGYINSNEIMKLMPELNDVEKQMADFNEKNVKYLQNMEAEITGKYEKYEQERSGMTDAIRKVREEELMGLQQRYQSAAQTLQQEAQAQQMKLLQPIQEKLMKAIEAVSKRMDLMFVYDMASGAVIYKSDKATDITPAVKKELGIL